VQPQRASRGVAAVALTTAVLGLALLALAVLLSGCGASSSAKPTGATSGSTSSSPTTTAPSTTTSAPGASSSPAGPTVASSAQATSTAEGSAPTTPDDAEPTETVPVVPVTTAPAVPLSSPAPSLGGGRISIGTITSIQGTAQLPGETAGPAVRVPVTIVNGGSTALDLDQVVVDLVDRNGVSASSLSSDPAAPFQGSLAPRASASAVYVFSLPTGDRSDVSVVVSYTTAAPVVVFTGSI
jgi:hypothetical protein